MYQQYKTEREWFEILLTNTPESMKIKWRLDNNHHVIRNHFAETGGLRSCVRQAADAFSVEPQTDEFCERLKEVHPKALHMLAKHGIEYWPFLWQERPSVEPRLGACYPNAYRHMYANNLVSRERGSDLRMVYVEGIGVASRMILHAWNALDVHCDMAIDITWYAMTGWYFYLGIPLTEDEFKKAQRLVYGDKEYCQLFSRSAYPKIESYLEDLLSARKEAKQTEAA